MGKYAIENYIVVITGKTYKYTEELKRLGFYYVEDLFYESFSKVEDGTSKCFITRDMPIEHLVQIIDFCSKNPLKVRLFSENWTEYDAFKAYNILTLDWKELVQVRQDKTTVRFGWGSIEDSLFRRQIRMSKDYFDKGGGFSVPYDLIGVLENSGITRVRLYDKDNQRAYFAHTRDFKRYGYDHENDVDGRLLCLPLKHWFRDCYDCPLIRRSKGPQVPPSGNDKADLMFVGEAPWVDEVNLKSPFVGDSGRLFSKILDDVNIDRDKCFITNTIMCKPEEKNGSKKPVPESIECCAERLRNEIEFVKPKVIVPLGKTACEALLPQAVNSQMTWLQERVFKVPNSGTLIVPMFHPSYILRNPSWDEGSPRWMNRERVRFLKKTCEELEIDC